MFAIYCLITAIVHYIIVAFNSIAAQNQLLILFHPLPNAVLTKHIEELVCIFHVTSIIHIVPYTRDYVILNVKNLLFILN